jgi:hypothetical protein
MIWIVGYFATYGIDLAERRSGFCGDGEGAEKMPLV